MPSVHAQIEPTRSHRSLASRAARPQGKRARKPDWSGSEPDREPKHSPDRRIRDADGDLGPRAAGASERYGALSTVRATCERGAGNDSSSRTRAPNQEMSVEAVAESYLRRVRTVTGAMQRRT